MISVEKLRAHWGAQRWLLKIDRSFDAFQPHLHLLETSKGQLALMKVAGIATLIAVNKASTADLEAEIAISAASSGIPRATLATYADSVIAMNEAYALHEQATRVKGE